MNHIPFYLASFLLPMVICQQWSCLTMWMPLNINPNIKKKPSNWSRYYKHAMVSHPCNDLHILREGNKIKSIHTLPNFLSESFLSNSRYLQQHHSFTVEYFFKTPYHTLSMTSPTPTSYLPSYSYYPPSHFPSLLQQPSSKETNHGYNR